MNDQMVQSDKPLHLAGFEIVSRQNNLIWLLATDYYILHGFINKDILELKPGPQTGSYTFHKKIILDVFAPILCLFCELARISMLRYSASLREA